MGFIRVIDEDEMNQEFLLDQDDCFYYPHDNPLAQIMRRLDQPVLPGLKIAVDPLQIFVILQDKKAVEVIDKPGVYIYHPNLEAMSAPPEYRDVLEAYLKKVLNDSLATGHLRIDLHSRDDIAGQLQQMIDGTFAQQEQPTQAPPQGTPTQAPPQETPTQAPPQGTPTPNPAPVPRFCAGCGNDLSQFTGIRFCPKCGKTLA